jgi:drug/metabolite transporter (DMT)-like permease
LLIGFAGALAISLGTASEGASQARGVVLGLAATACYGVAINVAGPLQARYGGIHLMSTVLGLATAMVAPVALFNLGANSFALVPAAALCFLGVVGTGLAYWMMSALVGRVGSIRASFITYLIPVVSLMLGVTIRGDALSALALIGMPATIAGAILANSRSRPKA